MNEGSLCVEQHVQRLRAVKGHGILGNNVSPAVSELQRGCVGMGMRKVVRDGKRQLHWGYFVKGLVLLTQEYEYRTEYHTVGRRKSLAHSISLD